MQRAQGKLVFFDTNLRANLWTQESNVAEIYSHVIDVTDYFFPSEEDLAAIYGFNSIDDIGDFCITLPCKTIMSAIVNRLDITRSISIAHQCASQVVQCKGAILPDSQWPKVI